MATQAESLTRSAMALAANPPKMTEWTAPMRAQASRAMASSGRHAHVDGDAVAFLDAERLEGVGELLHFDVELGVGEAADFAGLAFPDEGGLVGACAEGVAVDAVVAEVELAADEPFGPGEIPLEDFVPGLEPVEIAGDVGPEGFGIVDGLLVEGLVLGEALMWALAANSGGGGKTRFSRRVESMS